LRTEGLGGLNGEYNFAEVVDDARERCEWRFKGGRLFWMDGVELGGDGLRAMK